MLRPLTILTFLIFATVFTIIILVGCDRSKPFADPGYTITGTVTDSITGEPIDSAIVYYLDSSYYHAVTDSLGQFRYEHLFSMPSPLTCAKEGYVTKEIVIERVNNVYRYDNVNFQLVQVP